MNNSEGSKKRSPVVLIVLLVLLVAVLAVGGYYLISLYQTPMAEALVLPTATIAPPAPVPPTEVNVLPPTATSPPLATATPVGTCNNTGQMTLLFAGADFSGGVWPNGADAVRLVQVDFSQGKIVVVAFPRDLVVQTPGLAHLNMSEQRLGLAYFYEKQATSGTDKDKIIAGTWLLAQTMQENFGVRADHYFTLQLDSVKSMIDTVGGVEINVPQQITTEHNVTFLAGQQTLNGDLSAEYVRALQPGGENARLARQNQFLQALMARVISAGIIPQVPTLLNQFSAAITTDLSPKQMVDLACMVNTLNKDQIGFHEITSSDLVTPGNNGALIPNIEAIKTYLAGLLAVQ